MRIASLLPSATELLFAIGAGPEVVGVTHECDFPPQAERLPRLTSSSIDHTGQSCATIDRHIRGALHSGSSIYRLDEGLLAELRPDLIGGLDIYQPDGSFVSVAYFTSEAEARKNEKAMGDDPMMGEYMSHMAGEMQFLDITEPDID